MIGPTLPGLYGLSNWKASSSCGAFSGTDTSETLITNLSRTITTHGRPVLVSIIPDGSTSTSNDWTVPSNGVTIRIKRDSTVIFQSLLLQNKTAYLPTVWCFDDYVNTVSPASYTYTCTYQITTSGTFTLSYWRLFAWELGT